MSYRSFDDRRGITRKPKMSGTRRALIGTGLGIAGAGLLAFAANQFQGDSAPKTNPSPAASPESASATKNKEPASPTPVANSENFPASNWETWQPAPPDYDKADVEKLRSGIKTAASIHQLDPKLLAAIWGTETGGFSQTGEILPPGFHIGTKNGQPHYDDPARLDPSRTPESGGPFHVTMDGFTDAYDDVSDSYMSKESNRHPLTALGKQLFAYHASNRGDRVTAIDHFLKNPQFAAWTAARYLRLLSLGRLGHLGPVSTIYAYNIGAGRVDNSSKDRNNPYLKKFLNLYPEHLIEQGLRVTKKPDPSDLVRSIIDRTLVKSMTTVSPTRTIKKSDDSSRPGKIIPSEELDKRRLDLAMKKLNSLVATLKEGQPVPIPVGRKAKSPRAIPGDDKKIIPFPD